MKWIGLTFSLAWLLVLPHCGSAQSPSGGQWRIEYVHRGSVKLDKSNSDGQSKMPPQNMNTDPACVLNINSGGVELYDPTYSLEDTIFGGAYVSAGNTVVDTAVTKSVTKNINLSEDQYLTLIRFTWVPGLDTPNAPPPREINFILHIQGTTLVRIAVDDNPPPDPPRALPAGASASATAVLTCAGVSFPGLSLTKEGLIEDKEHALPTNEIKKWISQSAGTAVVDYPADTVINLRAKYSGYAPGQPANQPTPSINAKADAYFNIEATLTGLVLTSPSSAIFPAAGMSGNQYKFDTARPGVLGNPDWTAQLIGITKPASAYIDATTFTSFDIGGSAKTQGSIRATTNALSQKFTYTGLPANNSDFGSKKVSVAVADDLNQTDQASVQVFFDSTASNWPGTNRTTPNWFHYYGQVSPPPSNTIYDATVSSNRLGETDPSPPYQIHLGSAVPLVNQSVPCFALRKNENGKLVITQVGRLQIYGIHTYIEACGHELGHRQNMQAGIELTHSDGVPAPGDADGDNVLDSWEQNHYLDSSNPDTGGWFTRRGNTSRGDAETLCEIVGLGALTQNYGLYSQDWADPGIQSSLGMTPDNQVMSSVFCKIVCIPSDEPGLGQGVNVR